MRIKKNHAHNPVVYDCHFTDLKSEMDINILYTHNYFTYIYYSGLHDKWTVIKIPAGFGANI